MFALLTTGEYYLIAGGFHDQPLVHFAGVPTTAT